MATYQLFLDRLLTTSAEPRTKYAYKDGERTDKIEGYSYRLIDVINGEVLTVTIPHNKELPSESYVEVVNATGTPYIANNRATLSVKAKDIVLVDE
ncbi:hypothetical protein [Oceanobacillus sp. J11TS1]|uniref:hypothetical protein n=1 Tax=Oceanobacillus sp. J11TS1 TaxID=2807191 RepID=UPI001B1F1053|nr:hypothetical protein [Oceanobacillus sp. J11TS1]GIO22515.1 hypothetical protein J11TS1_10960 [Oceanobacillus sp. J11TS1]